MNFKNSYGSNFDPDNNQFGNASRTLDRSGQLFKDVNLDPNGNNEIGRMFRQLATAGYAPAASRQAFNSGLEGNYQKTLSALLDQIQNSNSAVNAQRAGNATRANYGQAQSLVDQSARASGLGEGAALGGQRGLANQAARAGAVAESYQLDPQRRFERLLQALGLMGQAQASNPYQDDLQELFSFIEQRNQANQAAKQQRGIGGVLGTVIGQYVGGLSGAPQAQALPGYANPQSIANWAQNFRP